MWVSRVSYFLSEFLSRFSRGSLALFLLLFIPWRLTLLVQEFFLQFWFACRELGLHNFFSYPITFLMDRPLPTELKHLSLENRCRLYLMPEGLTITLNSTLNFTQWTVEISTRARSNTSQSNGQPSSLDYKARNSFMDQHVRGHQIELRCQKFKCTLFYDYQTDP